MSNGIQIRISSDAKKVARVAAAKADMPLSKWVSELIHNSILIDRKEEMKSLDLKDYSHGNPILNYEGLGADYFDLETCGLKRDDDEGGIVLADGTEWVEGTNDPGGLVDALDEDLQNHAGNSDTTLLLINIKKEGGFFTVMQDSNGKTYIEINGLTETTLENLVAADSKHCYPQN